MIIYYRMRGVRIAPLFYFGESRRLKMTEEKSEWMEQEEEPVIAANKECRNEEALRMMHLLDKGTRQAFLDNELGVEDTKLRLNKIEEARKRCEAGDINACQVLEGLVAGLTRKRE
jgi:hypothetical protein